MFKRLCKKAEQTAYIKHNFVELVALGHLVTNREKPK